MLPIVASIVSGLISNGLPKIADAVLEKGVDYVEQKLGVTLKPEDEMKPEDIKDLRERAMQHAEFMAEIDAKDRASARDREVQISTNDKAPLINKIVTPVLALILLTLTFVLFGIVMFDNNPVEPSRKDILIYILGVLSAVSTQVVSYYFGSSQGSKDKGDQLKEIMK